MGGLVNSGFMGQHKYAAVRSADEILRRVSMLCAMVGVAIA